MTKKDKIDFLRVHQTWIFMGNIIKVFILIILLMVLFVFGGFMTVNAFVDEGKTQGTQPPAHHTGNEFFNIYDNPTHGFAKFLRWKLGFGPKETPAIPHDQKIKYVPDIAIPDYQRINNPDPDKIQVTWIGHSTFLIQVEGINILTDPVFNHTASPVGSLGPERRSPVGIPFDRLPPIHAVLQSHNHYDHLDLFTVKKLGNKPKYFVPLKLGKWFQDQKITNYVELDWWGESIFQGLLVVSVPIQHFIDKNLLFVGGSN